MVLCAGPGDFKKASVLVRYFKAGWMKPVNAIWERESALANILTVLQANSLFLEALQMANPDPPVDQPFFPAEFIGNSATSNSRPSFSRKVGVSQMPEVIM